MYSLLGSGAVRLASLMAVGRSDAAEANLIVFEEGNHEGLLVLGSAARQQSRQLGAPPLAYRGRQGSGGGTRLMSLNQPLNMAITHI